MLNLESRGIPVVGVATTEFIEAAAVQSEALGFDPAYIWVPHPIQDRTDAELHTLAEQHVDSIVAALTEQLTD
ncbi:MAG: hypothetical protein HOK21_08590 [Rhodospirillaceae bacterium]|jgi:hypothetical protein|nr:hypothetical protein [Rhodospirillaceae bacterium]MBT4042799.1 hypothetical protein [Rhodospirillaceae bacterium]MBT4687261.1 hypothetical protein [Rhodospirillaceae bacterium]MBT5082708.1 hypothetical protein [Rhodospirillaceae bacterium]MBT5524128.1 hypothetical protein [Rhodospirillaceae bacterium]